METAKEVKIFNLNRFFIERFRTLSRKFFEANRRLAGKRALWGTLLATLGTVVRAGDHVVFMSNGGFDGAPRRFLAQLQSA